VEQWLTVKTAGRGLSPHTVRAYRADVATFAAHLHGVSPTDRGVASRVELSQLTPGTVTAALSAIQATGAADKTRARLHGTLTGLFAYLIRQGLLEKDPVFLNTRLDPLSTAALDHSVRRWFARAGVPLPPGAAGHAFRHTVAMQLIGLGESATVVQDLLGHASLSSTQVYTKAAGRHVRAAANALPLRQLVRDLHETPACG